MRDHNRLVSLELYHTHPEFPVDELYEKRVHKMSAFFLGSKLDFSVIGKLLVHPVEMRLLVYSEEK